MISWLAEVPEVVGLLDTRPLPESPTDPGSIALAPPVAPGEGRITHGACSQAGSEALGSLPDAVGLFIRRTHSLRV